MKGFSLWPVFSNSVRYHIKGVNLVYKSRTTSLPSELSSRCAFLHTLDLSEWRRLQSVSGLGQCGSLHTLHLNSCSGVTDVSGLGQCGSLHTLNLSYCHALTDISGLGQCGSLQKLKLRDPVHCKLRVRIIFELSAIAIEITRKHLGGT